MRNILLSDSIQLFGWVKVLKNSLMHRRKSRTCIGSIISEYIKEDYTDKSQTCPDLTVICVSYEFYQFSCNISVWSMAMSCSVPCEDPGHPAVNVSLAPVRDFSYFHPWIFASGYDLVNTCHGRLENKILLLVFVKLEKWTDECPVQTKPQNAFPRNGSVGWWSQYSGTETKVLHLQAGLPVCSRCQPFCL